MAETVEDDKPLWGEGIEGRAFEVFMVNCLATDATERARQLVDFVNFANLCESPIEQILLAALISMRWNYEGEKWVRTGLEILPQHEAGEYRLDFGLLAQSRADFRIAIECDGHDFHERTPAQAERDRSRDRALYRMGWIPLRFTGREIVRDPSKCADEVIDTINEFFKRVKAAQADAA